MTILPITPNAPLEQMRMAKRWLLHKNKKPYYADGSPRQGRLDSPEDQARLVTFDEALAAFHASPTEYSGLGFALGPDGSSNHWQGIDLDNLDQRTDLHPIAYEMPGYKETSPSGKGAHAIGYGRPFSALGSNDSGIEAYSSGRYFTYTGNSYGDCTIRDISPYVENMLKPLHRPYSSSTHNALLPVQPIELDQAVINNLWSALQYLDADSYESWQRMGHALKTIGDAGYALWIEWSKTSPKFNQEEADRKWLSFQPDHTGYKVVFAEAQCSGWDNPARSIDSGKSVLSSSGKMNEVGRNVILRRGTDITIRPIQWLWPDWLPAGKLTILAGIAGSGKTTLALSIAAAITSGHPFPDGKASFNKGNILVWSGEDSADDTLLPRLLASGADRQCCYFIEGVSEIGGKRAFDPAKDMDQLQSKIESIGGIALLIIDPIVNAVSGNMNHANEVRRSLQGIVDLAEETGCAVIGITHFAKNSRGRSPQDRVLGSQAFGALARMVWIAATDDSGTRRFLAKAKSNIALDRGGFAYSLHTTTIENGIATTHASWDGAIEGTAREILGDVEHDENEGSSLDDAILFLQGYLSHGPVAVGQILNAAQKEGVSKRTLERAKKKLRVISEKNRISFGWSWRLPDGAETRTPPKNAEERHENTWRPSDNLAVFECTYNDHQENI